MRRDNVVLVGFMGAGKSVCGRLLARRLGRCFVETDDMIAASEGRSIHEIFRDAGEPRFRQLEADTIESLKLKSGEVIATGGGMPCRDGRMELLRELGTVVWLDGDVRELHARASRIGNRPMLEGRSMAEVEELYRSRQPYYRRAHITIDTTWLGADQVVARILSALREAHAVRA